MSDNMKPTDTITEPFHEASNIVKPWPAVQELYTEIDRLKAELRENQIYILNIERELARYREDV